MLAEAQPKPNRVPDERLGCAPRCAPDGKGWSIIVAWEQRGKEDRVCWRCERPSEARHSTGGNVCPGSTVFSVAHRVHIGVSDQPNEVSS